MLRRMRDVVPTGADAGLSRHRSLRRPLSMPLARPTDGALKPDVDDDASNPEPPLERRTRPSPQPEENLQCRAASIGKSGTRRRDNDGQQAAVHALSTSPVPTS